MATCFRCDVAYLMHRHGFKNVVEVQRPASEPLNWPQFDIYVAAKPTATLRHDDAPLFVDGRMYLLVVTGFSKVHSRDEDCNHPKRNQPDCGFPKVVIQGEARHWNFERLEKDPIPLISKS